MIAKYDKADRIHTLPYEESVITEELRQSTKPEDIQTCLKAGVLPACYEGSVISVEVQEQTVLSCFMRNDDGTVTCPMGQILHLVRHRGESGLYSNKDACR